MPFVHRKPRLLLDAKLPMLNSCSQIALFFLIIRYSGLGKYENSCVFER